MAQAAVEKKNQTEAVAELGEKAVAVGMALPTLAKNEWVRVTTEHALAMNERPLPLLPVVVSPLVMVAVVRVGKMVGVVAPTPEPQNHLPGV